MLTHYYLPNAPADTSLEELARVAKAGHRIEECIKRAKSEAGLADYEVRTWIGWHHHQTLSLMATWFLTSETRRGKKWTPAITIPQVRTLIALLLRKALGRKRPGWELRAIQRRDLRKEGAYADHWISRNLQPPLKYQRRT